MYVHVLGVVFMHVSVDIQRVQKSVSDPLKLE